MQALRTGIQVLRSASSSSLALSRSFDGALPAISVTTGARTLSQSAASVTCLDKEEVTARVIDLLKSIPFVDPAKVSPVANFKDDLQLDTLDNVEVMMAVEEEFAIDIPDSEASKVSTTHHLIHYIATHPQAK